MTLQRRTCRAAGAVLDRGASAVEYGLLIAAIAAVIVVTVYALGTLVEGAFTKTCTAIASADKVDSTGCSQPAGGTAG